MTLTAEVEKARRVRDAWLSRLDAYFADPAASLYTEAVLAAKAREHTDQVQALEDRLAELRSSTQEQQVREEQLAAVAALLPRWWEVLRAADSRQQKVMLSQLVRQVRLYRTHVEIEYAVALEQLLGSAAEVAAAADVAQGPLVVARHGAATSVAPPLPLCRRTVPWSAGT